MVRSGVNTRYKYATYKYVRETSEYRDRGLIDKH